jgi:hypothetical protein
MRDRLDRGDTKRTRKQPALNSTNYTVDGNVTFYRLLFL